MIDAEASVRLRDVLMGACSTLRYRALVGQIKCGILPTTEEEELISEMRSPRANLRRSYMRARSG